MNKRPQAAIGRADALVAASERRRLLVVIGLPALSVALLDLVANYGVLVVILALGLAVILYTRSTSQETIAAGFYGIGVLLICLFFLELYWNGAHGSTEPLLGTATRMLWQAVAGTVLIGLGLWLRRIEL